jgi:hypothetical protein
LDQLFWMTLHRIWSRWAEVLVAVKPETVVGWHPPGFQLFWKWQSRTRADRPKDIAKNEYHACSGEGKAIFCRA